MLADNIVVLKKELPILYDRIKEWQINSSQKKFFAEETRDSARTLRYEKDDTKIYIHSKYNPLKEAQTFIDKYDIEDINTCDHVVFFGIGLGYHIDAFLKKYPHINFSIVEPSYDIMWLYLENKKISEFFKHNLLELAVGEEWESFIRFASYRHDNNIKMIELPAYNKIFSDEYNKFLERFNKTLLNEKRDLAVGLSTQNRWISNCVNNFKEVLKTSNILLEDNSAFVNKNAIIVAAGPSLNAEIENLRKIKKKGLALIFSVGSAINTLIDNDIYPDAMCTYDPYEANQQVFKKVNELKIDSIPMIFGSSVGYEVLEQYKGQKINMIMSVDLISMYFLKSNDDQEIRFVLDAPSIANVMIELLAMLEFKNIVLVGQNLGYLYDKNYADGIDYAAERMVKSERKKEIEDVNGNMIETNDMFLSMKENMELLIARIKTPVINTTMGGANIKGTVFMSLSDLINDVFIAKSINGDEIKNMHRTNNYDKNFMQEQLNKMRESYKVYNKLLHEIKPMLNHLEKTLKLNKAQETFEVYNRMNMKIVEMENNDFFKVFGQSMNRVVFKKLVDKIVSLQKEKNEMKKIKTLYKPTCDLIEQLLEAHSSNELLLNELGQTITAYVND